MRTIELTAVVATNHTVTIPVPAEISPGVHRLVVIIDDVRAVAATLTLCDFPTLSVPGWPHDREFRRADIYEGDDA